jgi:hypothetical protein
VSDRSHLLRVTLRVAPAALPILLAAVAALLALSSTSDSNEVAWALPSMPVAALIGAAARANELIRVGVDDSQARWSGITLAGLGLVVSYTIWFAAVEASCHGAYECPL